MSESPARHDPRPGASPIVFLKGISKYFPGVVANDQVNLTVEQGEIHAICGENGAGKSTLMKILYGMYAADDGTMRVFGDEVTFSSPAFAESVANRFGSRSKAFRMSAGAPFFRCALRSAKAFRVSPAFAMCRP